MKRTLTGISRTLLAREDGFTGLELVLVVGIAGMMALLTVAAGYGINRRVINDNRVGGMTLEEVLATPTPAPTTTPEATPEVQTRIIEEEPTVVTRTQPPVIVLTPEETFHPEEPEVTRPPGCEDWNPAHEVCEDENGGHEPTGGGGGVS